MDIDTYIRQLEESKERGNKVTSLDHALSVSRSIQQQMIKNGYRIDFVSDDELRAM